MVMVDLERIQRLAAMMGNRSDSLELVRQMRCGGKKYPGGGKFFRTNLQNESPLMYHPMVDINYPIETPFRFRPQPDLGDYQAPESTGMVVNYPISLPERVPVAIQSGASAPVAVEVPSDNLFTDEMIARRALKQRYAESAFDDKAKSHAGAQGAWQIMPITLKDYLGRGRGKAGDLNDPEYNRKVRDWVMGIIPRDLKEFWSDSDSDRAKLAKLYAAYNWGAGNLRSFLRKKRDAGVDISNPDNWVDDLNPETRRYVKYLAFDEDIPDSIYTNSAFEDAARKRGYMAKGGKIHIKPENRGKFTALKKRTGHSASWFKAHGTPAQKKMAVFALNARKWKHENGGYMNRYDGETEETGWLRRLLNTPTMVPNMTGTATAAAMGLRDIPLTESTVGRELGVGMASLWPMFGSVGANMVQDINWLRNPANQILAKKMAGTLSAPLLGGMAAEQGIKAYTPYNGFGNLAYNTPVLPWDKASSLAAYNERKNAPQWVRNAEQVALDFANPAFFLPYGQLANAAEKVATGYIDDFGKYVSRPIREWWNTTGRDSIGKTISDKTNGLRKYFGDVTGRNYAKAKRAEEEAANAYLEADKRLNDATQRMSDARDAAYAADDAMDDVYFNLSPLDQVAGNEYLDNLAARDNEFGRRVDEILGGDAWLRSRDDAYDVALKKLSGKNEEIEQLRSLKEDSDLYRKFMNWDNSPQGFLTNSPRQLNLGFSYTPTQYGLGLSEYEKVNLGSAGRKHNTVSFTDPITGNVTSGGYETSIMHAGNGEGANAFEIAGGDVKGYSGVSVGSQRSLLDYLRKNIALNQNDELTMLNRSVLENTFNDVDVTARLRGNGAMTPAEASARTVAVTANPSDVTRSVSNYMANMQAKIGTDGIAAGSGLNIAAGDFAGVPGDYDIVTIEERVPELMKKLGATKNRNLVNTEGINISAPGLIGGSADVSFIGHDAQGFAKGKEALQFYSVYDPKGFRKLMEESVRTKTPIENMKIPIKAEELLDAYAKNPKLNLLKSRIDKMGLFPGRDKLFTKQDPRAVSTLLNISPKELDEVLDVMMGRYFDGFKRASELYPNLSFNNEAANLDYLARIGLDKETAAAVAKDPERVKMFAEFQHAQQSISTRRVGFDHTPTTDEINSAMRSNMSKNNGVGVLGGGNTIRGGGSGGGQSYGDYLGVIQSTQTFNPEKIKTPADLLDMYARQHGDDMIKAHRSFSNIFSEYSSGRISYDDAASAVDALARKFDMPVAKMSTNENLGVAVQRGYVGRYSRDAESMGIAYTESPKGWGYVDKSSFVPETGSFASLFEAPSKNANGIRALRRDDNVSVEYLTEEILSEKGFTQSLIDKVKPEIQRIKDEIKSIRDLLSYETTAINDYIHSGDNAALDNAFDSLKKMYYELHKEIPGFKIENFDSFISGIKSMRAEAELYNANVNSVIKNLTPEQVYGSARFAKYQEASQASKDAHAALDAAKAERSSANRERSNAQIRKDASYKEVSEAFDSMLSARKKTGTGAAIVSATGLFMSALSAILRSAIPDRPNNTGVGAYTGNGNYDFGVDNSMMLYRTQGERSNGANNRYGGYIHRFDAGGILKKLSNVYGNDDEKIRQAIVNARSRQKN